eukprot:gene7479-9190_t
MDMTLKGRLKKFFRECTFEQFKVHLVLLSIQLSFSVFYILAKIALKTVDAFVFLLLRLVIATPLLWSLTFFIARDQVFVLPTKREWIFLTAAGLLSVTANQTLFILGLSLSTASNAAITQPAIPIFSTLFGVIIGQEKKSWLKFVGIGVSVIGAILMIDFRHLTSDSSTGKDIVFGNLCFLGNTIAYALFLMVLKPVLASGLLSPAKCISWCFTIGMPPIIVITLAKTSNLAAAFTISWSSWLVIIYTATFATAYTFWASSWCVKKSDPTTVAVYLTVEPLATVIMAAIFLDEHITILNILGGLTILVGVAAVMIAKHKESKMEIKPTLLMEENKKDFKNNPNELDGYEIEWKSKSANSSILINDGGLNNFRKVEEEESSPILPNNNNDNLENINDDGADDDNNDNNNSGLRSNITLHTNTFEDNNDSLPFIYKNNQENNSLLSNPISITT